MAKLFLYSDCGLDNVWLVNGFQRHETGYGSGVSIRDLDGLHKRLAKAIIEDVIPLTGKAIKFLRVELDLSPDAVAVMLGKTPQEIIAMEASSLPLTGAAGQAVKDLYTGCTQGH
jgi:DNA-binding transcriptional regulator YiaG